MEDTHKNYRGLGACYEFTYSNGDVAGLEDGTPCLSCRLSVTVAGAGIARFTLRCDEFECSGDYAVVFSPLCFILMSEESPCGVFAGSVPDSDDLAEMIMDSEIARDGEEVALADIVLDIVLPASRCLEQMRGGKPGAQPWL